MIIKGFHRVPYGHTGRIRCNRLNCERPAAWGIEFLTLTRNGIVEVCATCFREALTKKDAKKLVRQVIKGHKNELDRVARENGFRRRRGRAAR